MIAFFPEPYPDELVYSWFARYAIQSGHMAYRGVASDLFTSVTAKPNIEFIMEVNQDAYEVITQILPFHQIIMKHTMFPYYARFLPAQRRQTAFDLLCHMNKEFYNHLYIRKNKTHSRQWLRYCPMCVQEDRLRFGETYWHRQHQLDHINVCPHHGCKLGNSSITITSKGSPSLIHAETIIPLDIPDAQPCHEKELLLAKYVAEVFAADLHMDNTVPVGRFLHHKMEHTKYLSPRGRKRYISLLTEDLNTFYSDIPYNTLDQDWLMNRLFCNKGFHTYDICLLAMFLGISVSELTNMILPEKSQVQIFDEQIRKLHEQGLNYRQISDRLGASYDYCKLIAKK